MLLKSPLGDESFSFGPSSDTSTVTPSTSSSGLGVDPDNQDDVVGHAKKKSKILHREEDDEPRVALPALCPRQPSPTDVRADPLAMMSTSTTGWTEEAVPPMPTAYRSSRIVTLPPTLRGVIDAAAVLMSSRSMSSSSSLSIPYNDSSPPPSLLSFPTESVYMLACCVRTASSRSVRRLLPRRADSQASLGSSCSSGGEGSVQHEDSGVHHREGGGCHHDHHRLSPREFVHPPNASLDWMMKCCEGDRPTAADPSSIFSGGVSPPSLFVLDGHHALSFCHFTKPKTFVIRPPPPALPRPNDAPFPPSPRATMTSARGADEGPTTPPRPLREPLAPASTPVVTPNTNRRLSAANFSESREAFLRLASKFWPGPVVIHVRVRTLGGEEDVDVPNLSREKTSGREGELPSSSSSMSSSSSSSSSSMIASFPKVPKSIGDLAAEAGVSVLPKSVLLSASRLLTGRDANDHDGVLEERRETYFVGMRCPSHPLSRKILNEAYRGGGAQARAKVSHSESSESLASSGSSSMGNNARARTVGVAIVGRAVPGTPSVNGSAAPSGATTAEDVDRSMSSSAIVDHESGGRIVIVDGEDNRESFSVPTCQYGEVHPVSLVVDGDSRTVHLIRRGDASVARNVVADGINDGTILSEASVLRALLKPASFHSLDAIKKGDGTGTIDRVITAALSRWKIQECIIRA